jgi:hypothetical protein
VLAESYLEEQVGAVRRHGAGRARAAGQNLAA